MEPRHPHSKIKTLEELSEIIAELKGYGHIVAQCHGTFDVLHPGHLEHFEEARRQGHNLVVTITADEWVRKGPGRPFHSHHQRAIQVANLEWVDYVAIVWAPDASGAIKLIKPSLFVKGPEYRDRQDLTGAIKREEAAVESVGGRIYFTQGLVLSSTALINELSGLFEPQTKNFLRELKARYSAEAVVERFNAEVKNLRVAVIGEAIIDKYVYVSPLQKIHEGTITSTRYISEEVFAGGILAVANHLAGFCGEVRLISCLGGDDFAQEEVFAKRYLKPNVRPRFFQKPGPTITKTRFIEHIRFDRMHEVEHFGSETLSPETILTMADYLLEVLPVYDLVLVVDYGYDFLTDHLIKIICEQAKILAVNTQTNSANLGFNVVTKYPWANFVCLNEPEIRLTWRSRDADLRILAEKTAKALHCDRVVVTRGYQGCVGYDPGLRRLYETPVFSDKVIDTLGAREAFFSMTAPCLALNWPLDLVCFIGNAAGAIAVTIVGNRQSVEPEILYKFIGTLLR